MTTLVDLSCSGGDCIEDAALCNAGDAVGAALVERGLAPGQRVAAAVRDEQVFAAAFIGVTAVRGVFVPLGTEDDAEALRTALRDADARFVLAEPEAAQRVRDTAASLGIAVLEVQLDERSWATIDGEHVYESHDRVAQPDDEALLAPDGSVARHAALLAAARRIVAQRPGIGVAALLCALARPRPAVPRVRPHPALILS